MRLTLRSCHSLLAKPARNFFRLRSIVGRICAKFLNDAQFLSAYEPINGIADKRASLEAVIDKCARALLQLTEFKRYYYNRTPQFTPFAWLRWQWPMANYYFNSAAAS